MSRMIAVWTCALMALSAAAVEHPLWTASSFTSASDATLVGAVPVGDDFFVVYQTRGDRRRDTFGTRILASGEVRAPRGLLIVSLPDEGRSYDLRLENGEPLLVVVHGIPEGVPNKYDYEVTRMRIDANSGAVLSRNVSLSPEHPVTEPPRNARGESLEVEYGHGGATLWFVRPDGSRRSSGGFPAFTVQYRVPYGDEWLILGHTPFAYVWMRISEARRLSPQTVTLLDPRPSSSRSATVHTAYDDGHFALVEERLERGRATQRTLTLTRIAPEGHVMQDVLIADEVLIHPPADVFHTTTVAAAKDGDGWQVAYCWWDDSGKQELRTWRVSTAVVATTLDTFQSRADRGSLRPRLFGGPSRNLLLFQRPRHFSWRRVYDLYAYVWPRGTAVAASQQRAVVILRPQRQGMPAAAAGPQGVLTAWREGDTRGDTMVRFFSSAGTGAEALPVSSPFWDAVNPLVSRNGDLFVVAWIEVRYGADLSAESYRVAIRRFDLAGNALDREPQIVFDDASIPDSFRLAVAPEGTGFRLAWQARSTKPLQNSVRPEQTVYTAHVAARERSRPEVEEVVPPHIRASDVAVVPYGADSVVLWSQSRTTEIYGRRYTAALQPRRGTELFARVPRFAAAANENGILLATLREVGREVCTDVQRVWFDGTPRTLPITLGCAPIWLLTTQSPDVVWDAGHWWVTVPTAPVATVARLSDEGVVLDQLRWLGERPLPRELRIFATGAGPWSVYVRSDPAVDSTDRAFVATLPKPKSRAARH